jgi:TolB-like protein
MPNDYSGIKKVRALNGQKFIDDFRKHHTIVVYAKRSTEFFEVRKEEVWRTARRSMIGYYLSTEIYTNGREVMVIL